MLSSSSIKLGVHQKMKKAKKRVKRIRKPNLNTFQGQLSKLYGKVSAYHKLGMTDEAKEWAKQLQQFLIDEGLLE